MFFDEDELSYLFSDLRDFQSKALAKRRIWQRLTRVSIP